jgi:hypothetical protein
MRWSWSTCECFSLRYWLYSSPFAARVDPIMQFLFRTICFLVALTVSLTLTSCGVVNGLLNTAMGLVGPAAQYKLMFNCIPEGTKVDTPDGARPIESLHRGDIVIGYSGECVRVMKKDVYIEESSRERFLSVEFESGAVVHLCDMHRIGGERAMALESGSVIQGHTVKEVRPFPGEVVRSYDLLTEDNGYQIGGIPVNSMIEEMNDAMRRKLSARESQAQGNWKE